MFVWGRHEGTFQKKLRVNRQTVSTIFPDFSFFLVSFSPPIFLCSDLHFVLFYFVRFTLPAFTREKLFNFVWNIFFLLFFLDPWLYSIQTILDLLFFEFPCFNLLFNFMFLFHTQFLGLWCMDTLGRCIVIFIFLGLYWYHFCYILLSYSLIFVFICTITLIFC